MTNMPSWLTNSIVAFLLGAIASSIVREFVSQWFGRPRIRLSVSDIWMLPSPHPNIEAVNATPALRNLLEQFPLDTIGWTDNQFSAMSLDKSILETIETEQKCIEVRARMEKLKNDWNSLVSSQTTLIYRVAMDQSICGRIVGALISFPDESPTFTAPPPERKPMFVSRVEPGDDGKEFVLLDFPGNPSPIVGHSRGIPELNKKSAALAHALSFGDMTMLNSLVEMGWRYNEKALQYMIEIRKELQRIRTSKRYLHVQVIVTNLGKEPSVLYPQLRISLDKAREGIELHWMRHDDPSQTTTPDLQVEEYSQSISLKWPSSAVESVGVGSILSFIPLKAGEATTLRFASRNEINNGQSVAVEALRNRLLTCKITLHASRESRAWWVLKPRSARRTLTFIHNLDGAP